MSGLRAIVFSCFSRFRDLIVGVQLIWCSTQKYICFILQTDTTTSSTPRLSERRREHAEVVYFSLNLGFEY